MSKLFNTTVIIGLNILLLFGCTNSSGKKEGTVDINDFRTTEKTQHDKTAHKPYEVEVNKLYIVHGQAYEIIYYQNENDTLVSHIADYGSEDDYDKADYKWLNDTTVSIRLYNPITNKAHSLKVFGYGKSNGMETDSDL